MGRCDSPSPLLCCQSYLLTGSPAAHGHRSSSSCLCRLSPFIVRFPSKRSPLTVPFSGLLTFPAGFSHSHSPLRTQWFCSARIQRSCLSSHLPRLVTWNHWYFPFSWHTWHWTGCYFCIFKRFPFRLLSQFVITYLIIYFFIFYLLGSKSVPAGPCCSLY